MTLGPMTASRRRQFTTKWLRQSAESFEICHLCRSHLFARVHSRSKLRLWIFCSVHTAAVVAEWLRRWTWTSSATSYPMGFPRAGSNPAGCESFCQLDPRATNIPYFIMLVLNILISELSVAAFLYSLRCLLFKLFPSRMQIWMNM